MKTVELYSTIKQVICDYGARTISRSLAAQALVDALHEIDRAAREGCITKSDKNRHFVAVLQHLSLIQRSPGTNSLLNRFSRANLLLNSRPTLVVTGVDFSGLSLPDVNLSGIMLIACNFDESDLRGARILNCQLQGCSFRRTDLSNTDFRRSATYGCGFEDANLRNAKGLA